MPTYQYACTECGHSFEQFQSFSDDALTVCPVCDGKLRKLTHHATRLLRDVVVRMNTEIQPDLLVNLGDDVEVVRNVAGLLGGIRLWTGMPVRSSRRASRRPRR